MNKRNIKCIINVKKITLTEGGKTEYVRDVSRRCERCAQIITITTNVSAARSLSILNEILALPGPEQVRSGLRGDVIRYLRAFIVHYLLLTLLRRDMERRVHIFRGGVHSRAVLQQQHNNIDIS